MSADLTPEVRELLSGRNMAHIATLMRDGAPQVSPVWVAIEGDRLAIFTQETNQKARNLRRDARVAFSVNDEIDPYRSALIRGRVVGEIGGEEALAIMDRMSNRYVGGDFPVRSGVAFLIEPESVRFQDLPFEHPPARHGLTRRPELDARNDLVGGDFPVRSGVAFLIEPESVRFQDLPFEHPPPGTD